MLRSLRYVAAVSLVDSQRRRRKTHAATFPNGYAVCEESRPTSSNGNRDARPARRLLTFQRNALIPKKGANIQTEYDIEDKLGQGGFGKVFKARHRRTGLPRAVKVIPKSAINVQDFEAEMCALGALDHPHIVKVIESFEDRTNYFLVQEICTGRDLVDFVLDAKAVNEDLYGVSEKEASIVIRQCIKAVICCHANGFIHRDVKLDNFMITGQDQTIKMIDFGVAVRYMPDDEIKELAGTFGHMAPEMLMERPGYNKAVDMWSLGVVLFALLSGEPFLRVDDEFEIGQPCEICDANGKCWRGTVVARNPDGTFVIDVHDKSKTRLENAKKESLRPNNEIEAKRHLRDPSYTKMRLETSEAIRARRLSADAKNLLERMLEYDATKRITALEALSHPFVLAHRHDFLGEYRQGDASWKIDHDLPAKLEAFASSPRLKQIALLAMAHLASQQNEEHADSLLTLHHMFRSMDKDGDGQVSFAELEHKLKCTDIALPITLAETFKKCDLNASGGLTYVEFVASVFPSVLITENLCREAFSLLDRECNGMITAADLKLMFPSLMPGQCEYTAIIDEAEMVIRKDGQVNGFLTFEDFHHFMRGDQPMQPHSWFRRTLS